MGGTEVGGRVTAGTVVVSQVEMGVSDRTEVQTAVLAQESLIELGYVGSTVRVHCTDIGDILHVTPVMRVLVVEATIINVLSDQFHRSLVSILVNL